MPFPVLAYLWDGNPTELTDALIIRGNESFHTYLMFKKNVDIASIESKITTFIKDNGFGQNFKLQSQNKIYFGYNNHDRWINKGDKSMVILLMSIAIGLLIISIINYINFRTPDPIFGDQLVRFYLS